jgi:hypothetical protein
MWPLGVSEEFAEALEFVFTVIVTLMGHSTKLKKTLSLFKVWSSDLNYSSGRSVEVLSF